MNARPFIENTALYSTQLAALLKAERNAKSVCDSLERREVPEDASEAIVLRNRITFAVENYATKRWATTRFIQSNQATA